jgi:hypothetical protein
LDIGDQGNGLLDGELVGVGGVAHVVDDHVAEDLALLELTFEGVSPGLAKLETVH